MDITTLDTDGALQEAADRVTGTRAGFLAKAAVAAGGLLGGGAALAADPEVAAAGTRRDIDILNFALTLEYLEATFYARALESAGLEGRELAFCHTVGDHEAAHVDLLEQVLGRHKVKKPTFDFGEAVQNRAMFLKTSVSLEDTGVRAYKGQAPRISGGAYLGPALVIHSIEAKHAAWVRYLSGREPAPNALDRPLTMRQVNQRVAATGFIRPG